MTFREKMLLTLQQDKTSITWRMESKTFYRESKVVVNGVCGVNEKEEINNRENNRNFEAQDIGHQ